MNKLILSVFMLLAVSKSNGQKITPKDYSGRTDLTGIKLADSFPTSSSFKNYIASPYYSKLWFIDSAVRHDVIRFQQGAKLSAFVNSGSDTLIVLDTVIDLCNNKIRYIKIGNKVYPLKQK